VGVTVDNAKVLTQQVGLSDVYQTLQTFMGGALVNYFTRFGRQWQVYVQAEGDYRTSARNLGKFYVTNANKELVPLSTLTAVDRQDGPEFVTRFKLTEPPLPGIARGKPSQLLRMCSSKPCRRRWDTTGQA
jgi:HAE1 family hydrophobic/amphiphilic exporter-1